MSSFEELPPNSPVSIKRKAYVFNGQGTFSSKAWDLEAWQGAQHYDNPHFSWYHVELPRSCKSLVSAAQYLIYALCPPLKLQDILALVSNGPFCGSVDGAIIFRANSAGPTTSEYTQKLAGRVTSNSVITVSLGHISRLEFSMSSDGSLLSEVPQLNDRTRSHLSEHGEFVIQEHVLEFYLLRNSIEDVSQHIPKRVLGLIAHVIETHIDNLQDILTRLELHLDENELELDQGGYMVKQQRLVDRLFPSMQLRLQRLLQVFAHGEQILPRLMEKFASKGWTCTEDIAAMQVLVARLQKQKDNAGFLSARITALQAGLDMWHSEQINNKLYYLSFSSIVFLPLSIVTSVFGMNVGGIPWTEQWTPEPSYGFRNVILLCATILLLIFGLFFVGTIYKYLRSNWSSKKKRRATERSLSWKQVPEHSNDYMCL